MWRNVETEQFRSAIINKTAEDIICCTFPLHSLYITMRYLNLTKSVALHLYKSHVNIMAHRGQRLGAY